MSGNSKRSAFKTLAVGCFILLLVAGVGVAVLVGMNWDKITATYEDVAGAVTDMTAIAAAVQAEYQAPASVGINISNAGKYLSVDIENGDAPDGTEPILYARDIATFVAKRVPAGYEFDGVSVTLGSTSGSGIVAYTKSQQFQFAIEDLLPAEEEAGAAPDE